MIPPPVAPAEGWPNTMLLDLKLLRRKDRDDPALWRGRRQVGG